MPTSRKIHSDSDGEEPTGEQWSLLLGCPTGYDMYWSRAGLGDPLKPRPVGGPVLLIGPVFGEEQPLPDTNPAEAALL